MIKQCVCIAMVASLLSLATACSSSRSVDKDQTIRIYLGFGDVVTEKNQREAQQLLVETMRPKGLLSEVADVLDVDALSPDSYVVYSGKLARQSLARGLAKQILEDLKQHAQQEDADALQVGLTRALYMLKQSNDSTRVYVIIVSRGLRQDTDSLKLEELIKQIGPYQEKLGALCILGVDGSARQQTAQLFASVREKSSVSSLSKENIQSCLPSF